MTELSQETDTPPARPDPSIVEGLRPLPVHYFRIPRHRWELMLKRLIQMGADAVQTPIPWAWHNPHRDVYDLTGLTHPERDVSGFLETCAALDLRVILHAGPYVGQGLLKSGLPY
jgi:beta-galactosidase